MQTELFWGGLVMWFLKPLRDGAAVAEPNFQRQVIENTNVKVILRQDDPNAVEMFSKIAETRRTLIPTYHVKSA